MKSKPIKNLLSKKFKSCDDDEITKSKVDEQYQSESPVYKIVKPEGKNFNNIVSTSLRESNSFSLSALIIKRLCHLLGKQLMLGKLGLEQ